ncbi:hypothetical protein ACO2Q1_10735 [Brevundimonas sp. VNH65]|uniref:hypothetical protein n=1 Tax=Brevundimonas sp. VNH65 TaxID=3400917 RepID=UPI003C0B6866
MNARPVLIAASVLLALLAGCERFMPRDKAEEAPASNAEPPPAAFASSLSGDVSGYYLPTQDIRVGEWKVRNLFVGQVSDFADWEGGRRMGTFAPVMIELEDETSPMTATELGEVRSGQIRVLPTRYQVTDDRIAFKGRADGVGEVRFDGRLDQEALATSRRNLGDEGAVLTGTLQVGGRSFSGVRLRWWAGD